MSKVKFEDCFNAETKKLTEIAAKKLQAAGYAIASHGQSVIVVRYQGRLVHVPHDKVDAFMSLYKVV